MSDYTIKTSDALISLELDTNPSTKNQSTASYTPEDINRLSPIELEHYILKIFTEQGWNCRMHQKIPQTTNGSVFTPDITLMNDASVIGFIECYVSREASSISDEKQRRLLYILEAYKPSIFILTDGLTFETYFDGNYVGTTTVPINYHTYSQWKRLEAYANFFQNAKEKTDGENC